VFLVLFYLYRKGLFRLTLKSTAVMSAVLCGGLVLILTLTDATNRLGIAYENIDAYLTHPSDAAGRTSLGQRFEMWRAALDAFQEAPLLGIGPGLFDEHLARLAKNGKVNISVAMHWKKGDEYQPYSHAHSEFFNTLATRGMVGIVTVLVLFAYLLHTFNGVAKSNHLDRSSVGLAGVLLVSGYLVFSLSEAVLYHAITANFFFLCVVSLLYLARRQDEVPAA
jgi:O-antigen ligase